MKPLVGHGMPRQSLAADDARNTCHDGRGRLRVECLPRAATTCHSNDATHDGEVSSARIVLGARRRRDILARGICPAQRLVRAGRMVAQTVRHDAKLACDIWRNIRRGQPDRGFDYRLGWHTRLLALVPQQLGGSRRVGEAAPGMVVPHVHSALAIGKNVRRMSLRAIATSRRLSEHEPANGQDCFGDGHRVFRLEVALDHRPWHDAVGVNFSGWITRHTERVVLVTPMFAWVAVRIREEISN